jgi:ribose-phosphate pyrophosphokinase
MKTPLILSTAQYTGLAGDISRLIDKESTPADIETADAVHREYFPDGEVYLRITKPVQNRHVVIVGGTRTAEELIEIVSLAWQAVRDGAAKLSLVIPYFGYSTMERAVQFGEVVRAKVNATLLSSIPNPPGGKTVFLVDLHAEGIQHYFEGNTSVVHLYAKGPILSKVKQLLKGAAHPLVVGSADTGRAKWVESYANEIGAEIAIITKRRHDGATTEILNVGGADVKNKTVLLYDDMIRSGGSIIKAAEAYRKAGASKIIIACTHLILTRNKEQETLKKVLKSADALIATDSVRPADALPVSPATKGKIHFVSLARLLAEAVKAGGRVDEKATGSL